MCAVRFLCLVQNRSLIKRVFQRMRKIAELLVERPGCRIRCF